MSFLNVHFDLMDDYLEIRILSIEHQLEELLNKITFVDCNLVNLSNLSFRPEDIGIVSIFGSDFMKIKSIVSIEPEEENRSMFELCDYFKNVRPFIHLFPKLDLRICALQIQYHDRHLYVLSEVSDPCTVDIYLRSLEIYNTCSTEPIEKIYFDCINVPIGPWMKIDDFTIYFYNCHGLNYYYDLTSKKI